MSNHTQVFYSCTYLRSLLDAAATRTYRLAVRFGLTPAEREDIHQDLILNLLEHADQFDPAKGSVNTFTGMVSRHRSVELLDRLMKDRSRLTFVGNAGTDDDAACDDLLGGNADPDEKQVVPMWADDIDLFSDSDTLRDLETALSYLTEEQAGMFALLNIHQELPAACKASGVSTATFYRRVSELQMHLRMFGFKTAA